MGCINSTKKTGDMKNENVFRVRVVHLQPDSPTIRSGFLELNPRELIFDQGRDPIVWALQHLRRYGLNGDVFSFEAGRRCMTGPGIYMFRCQQAERLYQLFQRYVNAVSMVTDESFIYADRDRDHPSHTFGRPETTQTNYNNYLEPAPMVGGNLRSTFHESFSSSPLSLELDSPDSVPSLSFTNEVVHFHSAAPSAYPNLNANVTSNVYLEYPLRTQREHNNNNAGINGNECSAYSTIVRKSTIIKRSSLDAPPEECAPMLIAGFLDSPHMYANVDGLGSSCIRREKDREKNVDPSERCYENLSRLDLSLLLQPIRPSSSSSKREPQQEQPTPSAVNYIVLDLDHPRSSPQCSPKTSFGSCLSLTGERIDSVYCTNANNDTQPFMPGTNDTTSITIKPNETNIAQHNHQQHQIIESTLGYSTIDFIKTCALIKSSTGADFDQDIQDPEESRITRHSKCVRKAYSISE